MRSRCRSGVYESDSNQRRHGREPIICAQGTRFVIGKGGFALARAHVLRTEPQAPLARSAKRCLADVRKADKEVDVAPLKLGEAPSDSVAVPILRASRHGCHVREGACTIGFPRGRRRANGERMAKGAIGAASAMREGVQRLKICAEV